jgi:hypothetical protein
MAWIIVLEFPKTAEETDLTWSNEEGFTGSDNYDTFTDEEKATLSLPMGGVWAEVPWTAEKKA